MRARGEFNSQKDFITSRGKASASSAGQLPELIINYANQLADSDFLDEFSVTNIGAKTNNGARKRLKKASRTDADFIYNKRTDKLYFNANGEDQGYVKTFGEGSKGRGREKDFGGYLGIIEFERKIEGISAEIFTFPEAWNLA